MPITPQELDRFADDIYKNRVITGSIYCGNCGYNLKTLPYVYVCPECGGHYNARPLSMAGIFSPHEASFPLSDIVAALVCAVVAVLFLIHSFAPFELGTFLLGTSIGVLAFVLAAHSYHRLGRLFKTRAIARRIAMEEG